MAPQQAAPPDQQGVTGLSSRPPAIAFAGGLLSSGTAVVQDEVRPVDRLKLGSTDSFPGLRPATMSSARARRASLLARFGPRLLHGLGNSHAPLVESVLGVPYSRPYTKMAAYLDALDAAEPPAPAGERMLAALGPRMLALARAGR